MKTIIENIHILTMDENANEYNSGVLVVEDDRIVFVGDLSAMPAKFKDNAVIKNGRGMLAMPGFINAHTHSAMSLFRGYANDLPLWEWLSERIWPLEDKMSSEDAYWLSMLSIAEMIASGTTTFSDMYMFMELTLRAVQDSGMRAVLARGLQGPDEKTPLRIKETEELIKYHASGDGQIRVMIGPHAIYTCSREILIECRDMAKDHGLGLHIHLSETIKEVEDCKRLYGATPISMLAELGLFDVPVLAAHCVHLTNDDMDILTEYGVNVVHCPASNMKLASGFARVDKLIDRGVCVALGTDGAASNNNLSIFKEMSLAALNIKGYTEDPTAVPAISALKMATINGAKSLLINKDAGSLEVGKKADIILINKNKPHYYPRGDIATNLVYSGQSADVNTVYINGKVVFQDGQYTTIDIDRIYHEVDKVSYRIKKC